MIGLGLAEILILLVLLLLVGGGGIAAVAGIVVLSRRRNQVACPDCTRLISPTAEACPHCGRPQEKLG